MPKVSVIVPNYNHARFLRKRIDSILAQTFQDFELILLDDCSTDDSRPILSSYSDSPHVSAIQFNEENSGSTFKQWNKGVRLARGEYVWIAESDDYADPRFLQRLVAVLDAKPEVVFVSCRSWQVTADEQLEGYADSTCPYPRYNVDTEVDGFEECRNYFVCLNTVHNASSVVFRKSVYDHMGGADEALRFVGDWKLWAAMALHGRITYLSAPLNYYRIHGMTVTIDSKRTGLAHAEGLRMMRWLLHRVTPTHDGRHRIDQNLPWYWKPAVASWQMPMGRRFSILHDALAIDPHVAWQVLPTSLQAVRLKFLRHWRAIRTNASDARS